MRKRNQLLQLFPAVTAKQASQALRVCDGDVEQASQALRLQLQHDGKLAADEAFVSREPLATTKSDDDKDDDDAVVSRKFESDENDDNKQEVIDNDMKERRRPDDGNDKKKEEAIDDCMEEPRRPDDDGDKNKQEATTTTTTTSNKSDMEPRIRRPPNHFVAVNNLSDRQYFCVWWVEEIKDGYRPHEARELLARVARHVNPILRDRGWRVKRLIESTSRRFLGCCHTNGRGDADTVPPIFNSISVSNPTRIVDNFEPLHKS